MPISTASAPPMPRNWLLVDLGVTFPDDREPGVDVVLPDIRFIEEERSRLARHPSHPRP